MTKKSESFDELYLNAPKETKELNKLRKEGRLLVSNQVEEFCRHVIQFGRLPVVAYEMAFSVIDADTGEIIKPDHATYYAGQMMKRKDVLDYMKELRKQIVQSGNIDREQIIQTLRGLLLDPDVKASDRIAAAAQLNRMENFNKEADALPGATLVINLPFTPQPLVSAPPMRIIDGEVVDN